MYLFFVLFQVIYSLVSNKLKFLYINTLLFKLNTTLHLFFKVRGQIFKNIRNIFIKCVKIRAHIY